MGVGIFLAATLDSYPLVAILALILLVGPFLYAHLPAYWPLPTMFLGVVAAASATGFINMTGNIGGFVGPVVVGSTETEQVQKLPPEVARTVGLLAPSAPLMPVAQAPLLATAALAPPETPKSYAPALFKLVALPLLSAFAILLVGLTRRRFVGRKKETLEIPPLAEPPAV
jgi:hypothetical protein